MIHPVFNSSKTCFFMPQRVDLRPRTYASFSPNGIFDSHSDPSKLSARALPIWNRIKQHQSHIDLCLKRIQFIERNQTLSSNQAAFLIFQAGLANKEGGFVTHGLKIAMHNPLTSDALSHPLKEQQAKFEGLAKELAKCAIEVEFKFNGSCLSLNAIAEFGPKQVACMRMLHRTFPVKSLKIENCINWDLLLDIINETSLQSLEVKGDAFDDGLLLKISEKVTYLEKLTIQSNSITMAPLGIEQRIKKLVFNQCQNLVELEVGNLHSLELMHCEYLQTLKTGTTNVTALACPQLLFADLSHTLKAEFNSCDRLKTLHANEAQQVTVFFCKDFEHLLAPKAIEVRVEMNDSIRVLRSNAENVTCSCCKDLEEIHAPNARKIDAEESYRVRLCTARPDALTSFSPFAPIMHHASKE